MVKSATPYTGPERRSNPLTEEQIEEIAEKAAEKAIERLTGEVYKAVGKSVIEKAVWIVGAVSVGVWLYLKKIGVV